LALFEVKKAATTFSDVFVPHEQEWRSAQVFAGFERIDNYFCSLMEAGSFPSFC